MAGVAVELAWQHRWNRVGYLPGLEPGLDAGLDLLKSLEILLAQQMLVEWADQHEEPVASPLEDVDDLSESLPLQRCFEVDPGIILFGDPTLIPGLRRVSQGLVGCRQSFRQWFHRVLVRVLQGPARNVAVVVRRLKVACPAIERYLLFDQDADSR